MTKIGDHCGVGWEAIKRISYGMAQPSLPLAMKIAEYFNTTVEDIYKLEDGEWGD
jgi:DNA-binding XRE family transcriptional regulator